MAESQTPVDALAGAGAPLSTDEALAMVAPRATAPGFNTTPIAPGTPQFSAPPAPDMGAAYDGGISPTIADQLRKIVANTNAVASANPEAAAAPGGWARALLGGTISAIGGSKMSFGTPSAGPLKATGYSGFQTALNDRAARMNLAEDRANAQKQQQFENKLKQSKEERDQEQHEAYIKMLQLGNEKNQSVMDKENREEFQKRVVAPWRDAEHKKGLEDGSIVEVNGHDGLLQIAAPHKASGDPENFPGWKWLQSQDVQDNGFAIGADGKPTGEKMWLVGAYPPARPLTQTQVDLAKKYNLGNFSVNDPPMDPRAFAQLKYHIQMNEGEEIHNDQLGLAIGKTEQELKDLHDKPDFQAASEAFTPFVIGANGDVKQALLDLKNHAEEAVPGPDGKIKPEDQAAADSYNKVLKAYGPDLIKKSIDTFEKEQIEDIKAKAAAAKQNPLQIEGDPSLHGQAYIDSLPAGRKPLIQMITSGQIGAVSPRLLSGKDGQQLMAEAAQADPDLDTSQIAGYQQLIKAFNTGKEAQQIKAINTGVPHLDDLYKAVETGWGTTVPGLSWIERKAGYQPAIDVKNLREIATQELAKIYATGAVTDQEHKAFEDQIAGWQTASEIKGSLFSMINALNRQVHSLENQWNEGLPSPHWRPRRAIVDQDAQNAMADVISRHSGAGPVNRTPAQAAPKPASQFSLIAPDGKTPLTFPDQKSMDDFKAAHGIK